MAKIIDIDGKLPEDKDELAVRLEREASIALQRGIYYLQASKESIQKSVQLWEALEQPMFQQEQALQLMKVAFELLVGKDGVRDVRKV